MFIFVRVNLLKHITTAVLSTLILISSMGFYVNHMVCGISGEHRLAINKDVNACSDECSSNTANEVKRSCCDFDSFYFKEDVPATSTESRSINLASAYKYIPLAEVFTELNCAESCCFHLLEAPDILPSVERHVLLETYLI